MRSPEKASSRRIAYLSGSTVISQTANSVHVMEMCHALASIGHDVTLHAFQGEGETADVYSYYGVPRTFRLARYPAPLGSPFASGRLPENRLLRRTQGVQALATGATAVRRGVRKQRPDLLYCRSIHWALASPARIPLVLELHGPPESSGRRKMLRRLLDRKSLLGVIVISEALRQSLSEEFPDLSGRLFVAHDAARLTSPASTHEARDAPYRDDCFRVGYVGHLYRGRGVELILSMGASRPDMQFHLVGGRSADIERTTLGVEVPPNVHFHGHLPHGEVEALLPTFDALLAPYQAAVSVAGGGGDTSRYMSPLKVFEYMASGRPLICSDIPVLREVLRHEENAILVPPTDLLGWLAALDRLRSDQELAIRIAERAASDVRQHHTWDARARQILDFLRPIDTPAPP